MDINIYKSIQVVLNQDFFAGVLILTAVVILIRQRHFQASLALLFFIAGYFVTQLPLISGSLTSLPEKYVAQGLISLCLVVVYSTLDVTKPLLFAAINEVILIGVNIVFSVVEIHSWFHWFIFSAVNWLSYLMLLYDYRSRGHIEHRRYTPLHHLVKTWLHVYSRSVHNDKKGPAMEKGK